MHHHAGLIGGRAARQRTAAVRTLAARLGDDLDRPIDRDEMWTLYEQACSVVSDRRTAESLRGVLGQFLLEAVTAEERGAVVPARTPERAAVEH